ncbi:hypothetical protein SAMN04488503_2981 [Humidesulfovibrio mexicanus]|uniref:PRTRC system protein F n=2 Tax=Humidesulfovibrio mexicanus TaxID=147047 RepID=A0A239C851_9BACT|nr:hypothetical protein SAMN04488503_2981 [Humidesulfovibrio mexicanus]
MPALASGLTLPNISSLPLMRPWHEVECRQGLSSFPGDPDRALLDLWPLFKKQVELGDWRIPEAKRDWTGQESSIEVLTFCWRYYRQVLSCAPDCPAVTIGQDERGFFVFAEVCLQDAIPEDLKLYWADLRHLPRLRGFSRGLWDYASDGLGLLTSLGVDSFDRWTDWFEECCAGYGDGGADEDEGPVQVGVRDSEAEELRDVALQVLGGVRGRAARKDLARRFEGRVRRAAVGPEWVAWGRLILTAMRDLGPLWKLVDQESIESGDFDGELFISLFSLHWCSPRFLDLSTEAFNDQLNNVGFMLPSIGGKLRRTRPNGLEELRAKALTRSVGLRALALALEGFNTLAEQACGVIDDDPR